MSEGAPMSLLVAATYPERTTALVLWGGMPRMSVAGRDLPSEPTTRCAHFAGTLKGATGLEPANSG
jgi:hypothetical protein